jgi:hypothetical protein
VIQWLEQVCVLLASFEKSFPANDVQNSLYFDEIRKLRTSQARNLPRSTLLERCARESGAHPEARFVTAMRQSI